MLSFVITPLETEMLCVCLGDCPVFIIIKFFTFVCTLKTQSIVTDFGGLKHKKIKTNNNNEKQQPINPHSYGC